MKIPTYSSIAELRLRTRAKSALFAGGINTVGDALAALEEGDKALLGLKGFGPKSLAELKERLRERDFRLPGDPLPAPEVVTAEPEEAAPRENRPRKLQPLLHGLCQRKSYYPLLVSGSELLWPRAASKSTSDPGFMSCLGCWPS